MPRARPGKIPFPINGLYRVQSIDELNPFNGYTLDCKNVWPIDATTGRFRGGVRPALNSNGSMSGGTTIHSHCRGTYYDSGLKLGIFTVSNSGTYETRDITGGATQRITTAPGTLTFPKTAGCAVFNGYLFQCYNTASSTTCRQKELPGGSETDLGNGGGGTAPTGFGGIIAHLDRLWCFNFLTEPSRISASAVGDFTNWDYDVPTKGAAYNNTGAEGGLPGEPILAAIVHDGQTILFGGPTALFKIVGNPNSSGLQRVAGPGPLMHNAWCRADDGATYMVTPRGLYRIPPGVGIPQPVSKNIPDEMIGLNPYIGDRATVAYDGRWNMLTIIIYHHSAGLSYFCYKLPEPEQGYPGGFFPMDFSEDIESAVYFPEVQTADASSVVLASGSGTAYQYDRTDTDSFDSYVFLGPFHAGDDMQEGLWETLQLALGEGSSPVSWELYAGPSAEEAYQTADPPTFGSKAPKYSAQFSRQGQSYIAYPRVHGGFFFLKLYDTANATWLIERIVGGIKPTGLLRVYA